MIKFQELLDKENFDLKSIDILKKFNRKNIPKNNVSKKSNDILEEISKTIKISEINYENLPPYDYFSKYKNFISNMKNEKNENNELNVDRLSVSDKFIRCLCKLYIGQIIHCKIQSNYLFIL